MQKLMTVSEIAKEAGVSVRTVQYYDNADLLKPSAYTEGGNRLYSSKELVLLHQIRGLKQLGLSLNEIKQHIVSLDEPEKVLEILQGQKESINQKIKNLQLTLGAIDILEDEIKNSNVVNFAEYAKILSGANDSMENLWSIKLMKPDLREYIVSKFHSDNATEAIHFNNQFMQLIDSILQAQKNGVQPNSPEGKALITSFDNLVSTFIDGNMNLLPSLRDFENDLQNHSGEFATKWKQVEPFINTPRDGYEGV